MLTDLFLVTPPAVTRWVFKRLKITEGAHEWLCEIGLCPCGTELDTEHDRQDEDAA